MSYIHQEEAVVLWIYTPEPWCGSAFIGGKSLFEKSLFFVTVCKAVRLL